MKKWMLKEDKLKRYSYFINKNIFVIIQIEMRKLELLFLILRINTSYEGIQETQNRVKEFIRREK